MLTSKLICVEEQKLHLLFCVRELSCSTVCLRTGRLRLRADSLLVGIADREVQICLAEHQQSMLRTDLSALSSQTGFQQVRLEALDSTRNGSHHTSTYAVAATLSAAAQATGV